MQLPLVIGLVSVKYIHVVPASSFVMPPPTRLPQLKLSSTTPPNAIGSGSCLVNATRPCFRGAEKFR
jgi:hypothetical protein